MASADFSDPVPSGRPGGSPRVHGPDRRPLEVRHAFFSRTRRIYPHDVCMTIGLPRRWPGYPRHVGLISACCTSPPRFRHQLSSDPASRRAPLPRRMVPVITVHEGLAPLECISLLDTPAKIGCQDWLNVTYFLIRALKTGGTERIVRIFGGALGKFHAASYSSINRWTIFTEPVIVWWMDL